MNIAITGGAGFIGSNLGIYLLTKGHTVTFIDNLSFGYLKNLTIPDAKLSSKHHFVNMDIRDINIVQALSRTDVLFHFAAISSLPECQNNPKETFEVNVAGTANILEAARRCNIRRIVFSSTSAVYENENIFPTPENIPINPTLLYSLSKKQAEEICKSYQDAYSMDIVILRFFNVYGPRMDSTRANPPVISYIIHSLKHGVAPLLHASGKQKRDMIYIDDAIKCCELTLKNSIIRNEILNVGSGFSYSIKTVYKEIAALINNKPKKAVYKKAADIWTKYPTIFQTRSPFRKSLLRKEVNKKTLASIEKMKKMLQWSPDITLREGLMRTLRHENLLRR